MNKTFAPENPNGAPPAWLCGMRPVLLLLVLASSCLCCHGQLPADLDIPSETLDSGYIVFQASNSITNSGSLVVQDPASVTLTAGSYIRLEPGFNAMAGAVFHALIDANVVQWQPIPVPPPPTACTDCGLNFVNSVAATSAQDMYTPNSSNQLYAYCFELDQPDVIVPCNISLSTAAIPNSNGHYHTIPPPPSSSISPGTGYTGDYAGWQMPVTLATTQVGQVEDVILLDVDSGIPTYYQYAVGYHGLVSIGNSNIFVQIGGNRTNHGDNGFNHYMTVNAASGLQQATTTYLNQYNPGQKICINDMALPIGGKFDICWSAAIGCRDANRNLIVKPWDSPHISHDLGTAADVAVSSSQCQPSTYLVDQNLFLAACKASPGSLQANTIPEGNHVHCRWQN